MSRTDSFSTIPTKSATPAFRKKLRVLIADDEHLSRERLKRFLRTEPSTEVVAECASGSAALDAIRQQVPDVAFLDVRMPELDAFGILEALRDQPSPAIILVTAFDHFALRAFDFDAVDYLLKPFDRQRFQAAMRRVRYRLQLDVGRAGQSQSGSHHSPKPFDRVTVRSSGRITLINTSDIDWVSAADNYVELHVGPKTHLLRVTISSLANRLSPNRFARISRSILVNQERIREIHSKSHGDFFVVLLNGVSLPGSRNYRNGLSGIMRG
jgi:two-component system LytT family response regulator